MLSVGKSQPIEGEETFFPRPWWEGLGEGGDSHKTKPPTYNSQLTTCNSQPVNGIDPQYTYDLNGNRTSMIGPNGITWTYEYDTADRLTTITNPDGRKTTFTYDADGRRTSMTYANGAVTSYTYDAAGRLTGISAKRADGTTISSYSYTHDNVGIRMSMTDNDGTHTYQYDDVYRLTKATHPQEDNTEETFTYDDVGNRLSSHLSSKYKYDNQNRLLEDADYTYTYNDNGNLISKKDTVSGAATTYQYNTENMLVQAETPSAVIKYQYDGFGRRISKTVNGVVTKYVYDNADILFELDEGDTIRARYTHGPGIDEPISVDRDTDGDGVMDATYYYHRDGLGSIVAMTDDTGDIAQTYIYDAFGRIVQKTGSIKNPYTYTGREWDEETGLYYYRARYYNAETGRWMTKDPIGFAGGDANFYVYVMNNPINTIDPLGLCDSKEQKMKNCISDCMITESTLSNFLVLSSLQTTIQELSEHPVHTLADKAAEETANKLMEWRAEERTMILSGKAAGSWAPLKVLGFVKGTNIAMNIFTGVSTIYTFILEDSCRTRCGGEPRHPPVGVPAGCKRSGYNLVCE